ncbi:DUF2274 domain-containing protein [Niveispirillum cyanobacteriorum]|uniref:DUF2274 domain-containing protein n=1 Tax=Niveispirillum cyanobacteriorum TaxID=1612173 RepID=A0A2K9NHZ4_9PROT|nr:DUF2274 domain-containing protein [Niveispirillum cyanobacteriorum]AUN32707.1 DUF2274 domain-containing protein [Niveispirillum cyanobacteriorum]GGE83452.1 hypothetical protein GCM10011317_45900 [Niveispirillum cyanobacteriorum]
MLKLPKLPDRTPVKLTVILNPELHQRLQSYAALYRETYGAAEPVADLIPYMLGAFLDSDRAYARAQKDDRPFAHDNGGRRKRLGDAPEVGRLPRETED